MYLLKLALYNLLLVDASSTKPCLNGFFIVCKTDFASVVSIVLFITR